MPKEPCTKYQRLDYMGKRIVIVNERGEVKKKYLPIPAEKRHFPEELLIFEDYKKTMKTNSFQRNYPACSKEG